jgi:hypothetical protein
MPAQCQPSPTWAIDRHAPIKRRTDVIQTKVFVGPSQANVWQQAKQWCTENDVSEILYSNLQEGSAALAIGGRPGWSLTINVKSRERPSWP